MAIDSISTRQQELKDMRFLPHTLMNGTTAMRLAGEDLTPQYPKESTDSYKVRINATTLYNGYGDTVKKMAGKVFSHPVLIDEKVNSEVELLLNNIDGQGRNMTSFFLDTFRQGLVDGISFVYVDAPKVIANESGIATEQDRINQGGRPVAIIITADNLLGFRTENIEGTQQLSEIRILEEVVEPSPDDEYVDESIQQIRLITRTNYQIFRQSSAHGITGDWVLYDEGVTALGYIPLIPLYVNRTGLLEGEPPLMALAELNLEHWISSSEQRNALTFARFAMLVFSGITADDKIGEVSPNTIFKLPDINSKWGKIDTAGDGITQGNIDIENIEKRMQNTGMTIRVQDAQGVTATAANIDSSDSDAGLMAAVTALEELMTKTIEVFHDYLQLSISVEPTEMLATINRAFAAKQPLGTVEDIIKLNVAELMTDELAMGELQRRGIIDGDVSIEDEIRKIQERAPKLSAQSITGADIIQQPKPKKKAEPKSKDKESSLTATKDNVESPRE